MFLFATGLEAAAPDTRQTIPRLYTQVYIYIFTYLHIYFFLHTYQVRVDLANGQRLLSVSSDACVPPNKKVF